MLLAGGPLLPAAAETITSDTGTTLEATTIASFDEPWAMTSSRALIRVDIEDDSADEAERFEWGERVREVEQGPDGALWVLEDEADARLLKLTPRS
jgi:glucose/arabinose dehydrogenase